MSDNYNKIYLNSTYEGTKFQLLTNWLKSTGRCRSLKWIRDIALKKIIKDLPKTKRHVESFINSISQLFEILDKHFPKQWDIHPHFTNFNKNGRLVKTHVRLYVVLYFPIITIKNDNEDEHVMTDVYLIFSLLPIQINDQYTAIPSDDIRLFRGSVSYEEFLCEYNHSHTQKVKYSNKNCIFQARRFCLGENAIHDLIFQFIVDGFDQSIFEIFLMYLKDIISYESIEGGPFIRIDKIGVTETSAERTVLSNSTIVDIIKHVFRNQYSPFMQNVPIIINNNKLMIKSQYDLEKAIRDYVINNKNNSNINNYISYLLVINKDNHLFGYTSKVFQNISDVYKSWKETEVNNYELPNIIFRGNNKHFIIREYTGDKDKIEDISQFKVHPEVINKLYKHLNYAIQQTTEKYYSLTTESASNNA